MKKYTVSWGMPNKSVTVRADDALDACARVRSRYGWTRGGSYSVDAKTRGDLTAEMLVNRGDGSQTLMVAVLAD